MKGPWHRKKAVSHSAVMFTMPTFNAARGYGEPGPTPKTIKDLGLAIEPIVGLRSYYLDADALGTPVLLSYNGAPWPHRAPHHAVCGDDPLNDHEVPSEECNCGIYAWRKELTENTTGKLYGEVNLWGDVLIGEAGYRAESAYPKNLTLASKPTRAVMRIRDGLAEAYGIPVAIIEPAEVAEAEQIAAAGGYISPAQYWQLNQIPPTNHYSVFGTSGATGPHPGYSSTNPPGYQIPPTTSP